MSVDGNWEVSMNTPMGVQQGTLTLATAGGKLTGKMVSPLGTEEFDDGSVDGNDVQWAISISKPMPMTLKFSATIDGDSLSGNVSLGMFGSAEMTGTRS